MENHRIGDKRLGGGWDVDDSLDGMHSCYHVHRPHATFCPCAVVTAPVWVFSIPLWRSFGVVLCKCIVVFAWHLSKGMKMEVPSRYSRARGSLKQESLVGIVFSTSFVQFFRKGADAEKGVLQGQGRDG